MTVYDPKLRCFDSVKQLSSFAADAYIVASEAAWIDITNQGVHKGTTVAQLQNLLAVSPKKRWSLGMD